MPGGKFTIFAQSFSENVSLCSENSAKILTVNQTWGSLEFLIWFYHMLEYVGMVPAILPMHDIRLNYLLKFQISSHFRSEKVPLL